MCKIIEKCLSSIGLMIAFPTSKSISAIAKINSDLAALMAILKKNVIGTI